MRACAIVVGAGSGTRANMRPPKQYQKLDGEPVFARTLNAFLGHPEIHHVTAVIADEHEQLFRNTVQPHLNGSVSTAAGGHSRTRSVISGLNSLPRDCATHVLIHDGVRPFVSRSLVDRVLDALREHAAVVPGIEIADALWRTDNFMAAEPVNRDGIMRVQTPQGFEMRTLLEAFRLRGGCADDDAAIAAAAGIDVRIVNGQEDNVKLTTEHDFEQVRRRLRAGFDIRTGTGFDVHRFGEGAGVILCGVHVPHNKCLMGHSDADAASHAITDAIYGALAQGDIGRWFPPSDDKWKGADSMRFLTHASGLAARLGYVIRSLDCTIVCEAPRIAPHAEAMRQKVAAAVKTDPGRISIKATTSEGLGFTGRGEGIAAMSTATLSRN